ncbi:YbhB/YbcL family Raf kinase inhibitor-like protein [Streptomyces sp. NPDC090306]|uniref:YbhB/YbcL family Raf kinase inhibitor-like protein n=1 Tax=unclassified Streptomyces TaxID=2593676 RepID=UPI0036E65A0A
MNRGKRTVRSAVAIAGAVAALSCAGVAGASPAGGGYGYTAVREGVPDGAARFTVTSPDLRDGRPFPADEIANAFGCSGADRQPRLHWTGAPAGTRSYAVTMFDPDAATGSGFWHWITWDIPAGTSTLDAALPAGAVAGTNDAGGTGYLGPCPPAGDGTHHYRLTVLALDVPTLDLPASTPDAVARFTMSGHVIGSARITATARTAAGE